MANLLCLDVKNRNVYELTCNELQDFYKALDCDCFDIARLYIGGKYFDCFVDDNGLFREVILPSAINKKTNEILLVGNIVFAHHDREGNTTSLSKEDIELIKENIVIGFYGDVPILSVKGSYFDD